MFATLSDPVWHLCVALLLSHAFTSEWLGHYVQVFDLAADLLTVNASSLQVATPSQPTEPLFLAGTWSPVAAAANVTVGCNRR